MEAGVDLVDIMKDEGFYVSERKMSNGTVSRTATDGGGAGFGRPVPIQLPTAREVEKDTEVWSAAVVQGSGGCRLEMYEPQQDGNWTQNLGMRLRCLSPGLAASVGYRGVAFATIKPCKQGYAPCLLDWPVCLLRRVLCQSSTG
jgi:hypothetical protein